MARARSTGEGRPEELPTEAKGVDAGSVLEYDPNAANLGEDTAFEIESAFGDGLVSADESFFRARDELEERLGGFKAVAAALAEGVDAGPLGVTNIMGIGVGYRLSADSYTGELAVKVYVREKAPSHRLQKSMNVPSSVNGVPTDVEAVGEIRAQTYNMRFPRPVPCGVSCGHVAITAGTIGCLVVLDNNRLCVLSNNHVLANQNNARPGDAIIQPGRVDGGRDPADRIGVLERFVPIQFPGPNLVNCAAAWTSNTLVKPQHMTYRMDPRPLNATLGLSVMKNGRTTQATQGTVTGIGVNGVQVSYDRGVATFNNQVIIQGIGGRPFSAGGDSGSIIVAVGSRRPTALLYAGSATHTIANPIAAVMTALRIKNFVGG